MKTEDDGFNSRFPLCIVVLPLLIALPFVSAQDVTCDPSICLNGGRCNGNNIILCTCLPGYTGIFCESELKRSMNITARLVIYELYVDEIRQNLTHSNDWTKTDEISLSPNNRLIAILAADVIETCSGILGSVTDDYLVTDATWKCVMGQPPDFYRFGVDDSGWPAAFVIGPNGDAAWPGCVAYPEFPNVSKNASWIRTSTMFGGHSYSYLVYCRAYLPFCETAQPCQNGGTCNKNNATLCSCPGGFTGVYCESLL